MPYIGNTTPNNFVSVVKDTFSGNGSATAFTLSKTATTNGVAVYVENVRQIPTTAYAVSGTTLTFTGAPVSGTNNIYVMHHNAPASTVTHPAAQPLTATSGTFTSDVSLGDSDKLILGAGSDLQLYHDGSHSYIDEVGTGSLYVRASIIRWTNADGSETLGGVDADGGWFLKANNSNALVIDADGHVTKPLQHMYRALLTNRMSLSGSAETQVTDITENIDIGGNASGGTFTCPVAGKYLATFSGSYRSDGASYVDANIKQNTSYAARAYSELPNAAQVRGANAWHPFGMSGLMNCSANDTIKFFFGAGTGASQLLETPYTVMQVILVG